MNHRGIWMAEDDREDCLVYQDVLKNMRLREPLIFFPNGKTLWTELLNPTAALPRLLIIDGLMPFLNGWDVIENMRQSNRYADVHIVLLTGHYSLLDEAKGDRYGVRVETKPSRLKELQELFRELLLMSSVGQKG